MGGQQADNRGAGSLPLAGSAVQARSGAGLLRCCLHSAHASREPSRGWQLLGPTSSSLDDLRTSISTPSSSQPPGSCRPMGSRLLRAALAALLVALAIGVAQKQGLIEQRHLHQLHLLRGRLLEVPAVAAAADRLRGLFPQLGALLPRPGEPGCSCGVSGCCGK